jgi:hypothetical protein
LVGQPEDVDGRRGHARRAAQQIDDRVAADVDIPAKQSHLEIGVGAAEKFCHPGRPASRPTQRQNRGDAACAIAGDDDHWLDIAGATGGLNPGLNETIALIRRGASQLFDLGPGRARALNVVKDFAMSERSGVRAQAIARGGENARSRREVRRVVQHVPLF